MIWLELTTTVNNYSQGWNYRESAWAPTRTRGANPKSWAFWSSVNEVVAGDIVVHLRNERGNKRFEGFSIAAGDGYITSSLPTQENHRWQYSHSFYKVDLTDFRPFNQPILLSDFFQNYNVALRRFFAANEALIQERKRRLFYVIQNDRLQCLNGAYFSDFDWLAIAGIPELAELQREIVIPDNVPVGEEDRMVPHRIGHNVFSDLVKQNFYNRCCFPDCPVDNIGFLVSGHIARWADDIELRGNTRNGLCFCLMHDKAFEKGYFTLDNDYRVVIVNRDLHPKQWLQNLLEPYANRRIRACRNDPSIDALHFHWHRIGYNPPQ